MCDPCLVAGDLINVAIAHGAARSDPRSEPELGSVNTAVGMISPEAIFGSQ